MASLGGAVEITDLVGSDPEHINGNITTAGSPDSLIPSNNGIIILALIKNPSRGPNQNDGDDVLLINIDGTTTYISLNRGEAIYIPGNFSTLKIDSNNNGVNYEAVLWSNNEDL